MAYNSAFPKLKHFEAETGTLCAGLRASRPRELLLCTMNYRGAAWGAGNALQTAPTPLTSRPKSSTDRDGREP
jgi:hypothetical protein